MQQQHHIHRSIFAGNQKIASQIRTIFRQHQIVAINLISSPGAGKTTILEKTIDFLSDKNIKLGVIEGDIATTLDAERIAAHNVKSVQINTHGACHLDADMIQNVLSNFQLDDLDLLIIENVGNLVCPSDFDLGEHYRIAVASTTEGEDKVNKYPSVFKQADAVLLNKTDLLPYIPFNQNKFSADLEKINGKAQLFKMSALEGEGIDKWVNWLEEKIKSNACLNGKG
ncbi:hydrogenase nickel incorporation protein HypB [Pseudalkalibacillus sp. R45]|uniref:hydrogenase nickel incorporation protein HypB n=1 Tax=Pseudalkalibacillus sp. R45 TaxID=3457433 RepID=UPI003FCDBEE8